MLKGAAFLLLALVTLLATASPLLAVRGRERARLTRRLAFLGRGDEPVIRYSARLSIPSLAAPMLARAQLEITTRAVGVFAGGMALTMLFLLLLGGPVLTITLLPVPPFALFFWIRRRAQQRVDALVAALPFYIDAVRQMQAVGSSLPQALERALTDAPDIVRSYLAPAARRLELGAPVSDAMQQLADRLRVPEMSMFAAAIRMNMRYGGSINAVLNNLASILRERVRIARELKAATSEAKVSARVLIAMPLVAMLLLMASNPAYIDFFLSDGRGNKMAVIAIALQAGGILVMRRVMRLVF